MESHANNIDSSQDNNLIDVITRPSPVASHNHSCEDSFIAVDTGCPPSYSSVLKDPPPNYNHTSMIFDSFLIFEPIQPQKRWSSLKKLYIFGYIFWPFWFVGTFYLFSDSSDKKYWAKRCLINTLIFLSMVSYVVVIIVKTKN